jgi:Rha family phage regulatory protein
MGNQLMNLGLTERGGKVVVSSRDIARVFEKEHRHVLRDIRGIIDGDKEWGVSNFGQMSYKDSYGRDQTEYAITRDGFTILAMGYTGEKAMAFKKAYIAAFNEMERKLQAVPSITDLVNNPQLLLSLLTKHIETQRENERLQITAAKYEGRGSFRLQGNFQSDSAGLYKIGEIAEELGTTAKEFCGFRQNSSKLNRFLKDCGVQYRPMNFAWCRKIPYGSQTWRLYSKYLDHNIALPRYVTLENGYDMPMLLWTAKGRDFIFDLAERELPAMNFAVLGKIPWYA